MDGANVALRLRTSEADVREDGLTLLADPSPVDFDVVFVHGFTGHPQHTWTWTGEVPHENRLTLHNDNGEGGPSKLRRLFTPDSSKKAAVRKTVFWPKDLLPTTLPNARIFTYGYDSRIRHPLVAPASKSTLYDLGHELLLSVEAKRNSQPSRPLVFIAHSLGGIVVKEALRRSEGCQTYHKHLYSVYNATAAVICFGTPHGGADPRGPVHHVAEAVVRVAGYAVNDELINSLLPSSEKLRELRDEFSRISRTKNWMLFSFQEQYGLKLLNGRKVVNDSSSTFGDPTTEIVQHIANNHMEICRFKGLDDHEYEKVAAALQRVACIIMDKSEKQEVHSNPAFPSTETPFFPALVTAEERGAYLESLSFRQIDARLLNIKKAHEKTCNWLFDQLEYKQWLDCNLLEDHHGFLWIRAKPGAGKSTMMKYALLEAKTLSRRAVIISFFFNARGDILEKSTLGMYRSLLYQLLTAIPALQDEFVRMFSQKRTHSDVYEWIIVELKEFFHVAAKGLQQYHVFCFIDALDECEETEVRDLIEFLEDLGDTAVSSRTSLNICLSSRHYPHIYMQRGIQLNMDGKGGHDKDIEAYVESKLNIPHTKEMDEIRAEILTRASGVFLWVELVVKMLNKEYDHGQIHALRRRLKEIPDELDNLFADILTRDAERMEESVLCLQWLLFAKRPLRREELYFGVLSGIEFSTLGEWKSTAVGRQIVNSFILSCSKGLAEVSRGKDENIQFIHESVRDFFLLRNGLARLRPELAVNVEGLSQDKLKICCYNYIITDVYRDLWNSALPDANSRAANSLRNKTSVNFPFLEYAVHNVFHHSDAAQSCGISQREFLREFDHPNLTMRRWLTFENIFHRYQIRRYSLQAKLLYIVSENGLQNLVKVLLNSKAEVNAIGERYGSAIQAASSKGHAQIVQYLIDAGADVNIVGGEYGSSLGAAVSRGHEMVVQLLLKSGASHAIRLENKETFLLSAVEKGNKGIVQLLLNTFKVDPNLKDINGRAALSCAVQKGYATIAQELLINHKIDPNIKDNESQTPLCLAVKIGNEAIVQALLATPTVDPNLSDENGRTPLSWAASMGHEAIVQVLLATSNVDPNCKDNNGQTPLSWAATMGHEAIVQVLLATPNVDPNVKDNGSQTPLSIAVKRGNEAIVQALLASPTVDPNLSIEYGRTPLSWAASMGHEAIVQVLLATPNVDPNLKDDNSQIPLSWAAAMGHEAIVQMLLSNPEIDPNVKDCYDRTALILAAYKGREAILQMLLSNPKVDPNLKDCHSRTALSAAANKGHEAIVQILLAHPKVDPNAKNNYLHFTLAGK